MRVRAILLGFWFVCLLATPLILLWQLALIPLNPARSLQVARAIDISGATALFGSVGRTISYKSAVAAQHGNVLAKMLCEALGEIAPHHCQDALTNGDFVIKRLE